jgi:hypothetical protein
MDRKEYLLELARSLDEAERFGADEDEPEGARWIQLTDTLAKQISSQLREIAGYVQK